MNILNKSGKWVQLSDDSVVAELMSQVKTKLQITGAEKRDKAKSLLVQTEKADGNGGAPAAKTSVIDL